MIMSRNEWIKLVRDRARAGDLDAERIHNAIKDNARWNADLRKEVDHGTTKPSDGS